MTCLSEKKVLLCTGNAAEASFCCAQSITGSVLRMLWLLHEETDGVKVETETCHVSQKFTLETAQFIV